MSAEIRAKLESFKKKLPVDRIRLDEEAVGQSALYGEVGELVTELKAEARIAKNHLDFVKAKVRSDIRKNPAQHDVAKPTIDSVEDACLLSTEYITALSDYSEKQHLADAGAVLLEAAAQRKSIIRDAVSLFVHNYYMTTQDMGPEKRVMNEVSEDAALQHRRRSASQRNKDIAEEGNVEN